MCALLFLWVSWQLFFIAPVLGLARVLVIVRVICRDIVLVRVLVNVLVL